MARSRRRGRRGGRRGQMDHGQRLQEKRQEREQVAESAEEYAEDHRPHEVRTIDIDLDPVWEEDDLFDEDDGGWDEQLDDQELHFRTSLDDISELLIRRVHERVEKRLFRRYTWIGTVLAVLASGGGYLVLENASGDPSGKLIGVVNRGPGDGTVGGHPESREIPTHQTSDGTPGISAGEQTLAAFARVDAALSRLEMTEQTLERFGAELGEMREEMRRTASKVDAMREGSR